MGPILKFIVFASGIFFLLTLLLGASTMKFILRLIFGGRKRTQNRNHQSKQEPASQSERIITYKKKEFETSAAEDVEFEEIKEDEK